MKKLLLFIPLILLTGCLKDEIEENSWKIDQLSKELNEVKSEIDRINKVILSYSADISSIKFELIQVKNDVNQLDGFVRQLQSEVSELNGAISFINNYLTELRADISDLEEQTQQSLNQVKNDYKLLEYCLNYLLELQKYQHSLSNSDIEYMLTDLQNLIENYNQYGTLYDIKTTIVGDIKSKIILNGVNRISFGNGAVPGTLNVDCNWVRILSDKNNNLVSALNPINNTLLMTHHSDVLNQVINDTPNDNLKLYKNFFQSPKKILYVSTRNESDISIFINYLESLGHEVTYIKQPSNSYDISDVPELSFQNLDKYQGLIWDDNMLRPSLEIQNNLKNFFKNPTKSSVISAIGWVWVSYRANYDNEKYPLNSILESMGASYTTWTGYGYAENTYNFMNYYPRTYNESIQGCN